MFYERNNSVSYTGRAIIPGEFHLKCTNNSWNNGSRTFITQKENRNTSARIFLRARCNAICLYKFKDKNAYSRHFNEIFHQRRFENHFLRDVVKAELLKNRRFRRRIKS